VVTFSEQIDNAAWANVRGVVTANSTISPSGYQDADTFASAAAQAFPPALTRNPTYAGNTNYTLSVFAKVLGNTNTFRLDYVDNLTGFTGGGAIYNLATQVITITQSPNASVTASMQDYGNGWYRLVLSFLTIATPTFNYFQIGQTTNDVANGFAIWGAQLEAGAYATSYIPTLAASVTRVADVCNKTSASALIGQTEGTLYAELSFPNLTAGGSSYFYFTDGSFSNSVLVGREPAIPNPKYIFYINAGGSVILANTANNVQSGFAKLAIAYKSGSWAAYLNGTLVASGTSTFTFGSTLSRIGIGTNDASITIQGDSMIAKEALLFKTRLTNAQLAELTTL
jgi:hypothetical protein